MNDEKRAALVDIIGRAILAGEMSKGSTQFVTAIDTAIVEINRLLAENTSVDNVDWKREYLGMYEPSLDIDAMLDAVHPQARLNYLGYADFDLCWNAYLWTPDFVATTGTGPTRTAAIADACRKAREQKEAGDDHH